MNSKIMVLPKHLSIVLAIPGNILWFDAMDPNNTGIAPVNDSNVTKWYDKSGLGNNATANTPIVYNTTGLNGYPALTFTNTQWLTGSVINSNPTMSLFGVCIMN